MEWTTVLCCFLENLPTSSIHYLLFLCCRITENVWKNSDFLKSNKGLLGTPDLVSSFFQFISYIFQRESDKYIQLARISVDFVFPNKLVIFPPSCPDYPSCVTTVNGFILIEILLRYTLRFCFNSLIGTVQVSCIFKDKEGILGLTIRF